MAATDLEWYRDALKTAYAALDGDSNDAEHDALVGLVEVAEDALKAAGVALPSSCAPET
jgi:hypothetical protein